MTTILQKFRVFREKIGQVQEYDPAEIQDWAFVLVVLKVTGQ